MPLALALVIAAVKAGCLVAGSLIHEGVKFVNSLGADHKDTARGPCLLIKDQKLGQDTPKESPSDALILYASRYVVPSSSSRELVSLRNDSSALGSQVDMTDIDLFSVMTNSFNFLALWSWFRARCISLIQSALRSVLSDMKMSFALFCGSVSDNAVQKKQVASIVFLIQVYFTMFMTKVFVILIEAARLFKSRTEKNVSTLLGQLFPAGFEGERKHSALLTNSTSVGVSSSVDINALACKYLAIVITSFKQALAMFSGSSISLPGRLMRLHTTKVMTFVLLLGSSISLIGWSIPSMVFDGSNPNQYLLQQPAVEVEVGPFSSVTSLFTSLPVGTSNSLNSMESIGSFDDQRVVSMNAGAIDRQGDLKHAGLVEYNPSILSPANDFSATSNSELQTGYMRNLNDEVASVYFVDRSRPTGFGSTLDSCLHINVLELPSDDYASIETATTEHSGTYIVSAATADEAFVTRSISHALHQSSVRLETSPSSSAADGDTSTKPMIIIVVGRPQELFNYLWRKVDGCSDSMQVNDRNSSTTVQVHVARTDLDHSGLTTYNREVLLLLYVWSENGCITASLSGTHTSFFWNYEVASVMPFHGNIIGVILFIPIESSLFYTSGDLSPDGHAASHFSVALDSPVVQLDHSLPNNTDTSGMQMITTELEPSQELPTNQGREFDGSSTQEAIIYPQLMLPAPSDRTNRFELMVTSVLTNHSRRFSSAHSSLRLSALKERHIFIELRQVALMLLMLAYHNSDGTANEPGSVTSPGTDLELEDVSNAEDISADGDNEEVFVLPGDTNTIKPSRREVKALHSDLGRHWSSPSKRRMRRSSRTRSRPQYFQPT